MSASRADLIERLVGPTCLINRNAMHRRDDEGSPAPPKNNTGSLALLNLPDQTC